MSLPAPEFRLVPPPADGLAGAFRAAAQRRRRKAATTGGAGVLTAAVAFAVLTGSTGQVLTTEPAPPADQRPSLVELVPAGPLPSARPDEQADQRSASTTQLSGTTGAGRPATASRLASGTRTGARPAAAGPAATTPRKAAAPYRVGDMKRTGPVTNIPFDPVDCTDDDLCTSLMTSGSGKDMTLHLELCSTATRTLHLDFPRSDEVDISVSVDGGAQVWRWSAGRPAVADPHQVRLEVGDCLVWETPWASVDQTGRALGPADYVLSARFDSPDLTDARPQGTHSVY